MNKYHRDDEEESVQNDSYEKGFSISSISESSRLKNIIDFDNTTPENNNIHLKFYIEDNSGKWASLKVDPDNVKNNPKFLLDGPYIGKFSEYLLDLQQEKFNRDTEKFNSDTESLLKSRPIIFVGGETGAVLISNTILCINDLKKKEKNIDDYFESVELYIIICSYSKKFLGSLSTPFRSFCQNFTRHIIFIDRTKDEDVNFKFPDNPLTSIQNINTDIGNVFQEINYLHANNEKIILICGGSNFNRITNKCANQIFNENKKIYVESL